MIQLHKKITYLPVCFAFLLFFSAGALAQTPGGTGLTVELWLAADKLNGTNLGSLSDLSTVSTWNDLSGKNMNFGQNGTNALPRLNYAGMNFQPAIEFYQTGTNNVDRPRKLISNATFTTATNKAYYTFWVSSYDNTNPDNACVFAFPYNNNPYYNRHGWNGGSSPAIYFTTNSSSERNNSGFGKRYGIGTVFRSSTTADLQYSYHNGVPYSRTGAELSGGTAKMIIGNDNLTNDAYFYGSVEEIILLSANKGALIQGELDKVHSYLAIKYGQSMANLPNFVNAAGSNVWTGTSNNGYTTHIFGIGRDDASGLYQKQSANYEYQGFTVFVGNNITDINNQNTGTLDNGTYLILGSNGTGGRTAYSYTAGTQFANASLDKSITERFSRIYKSQLTGTTDIQVNMRMRAQYVLVSNSPTFPQGNATRIYPVEGEIARNIQIEPGDYIGFVCPEVTGPGGITSGLRMWLRADYASTLSVGSGGVSEWRDMNRDDLKYVSNNTKPVYTKNHPKMNFHPSLHFRDQNSFLGTSTGIMSVAAPSPVSFISLVNVTQFGSSGYKGNMSYFMGFGTNSVPSSALSTTTRRPAFGVSNGASGADTSEGLGRFIHYSTTDQNADGTKILFKIGATTLTLHQISRYNNSEEFNVTYEIGANVDNVVNATAPNSYSSMEMNGPSTLGGGSYTERNLIGYMSEMIAYERHLTADEKNKVYSYLAIKYGVTLDPDPDNPLINYDYILSNGAPVWPGTTSSLHQPFHHNVAMIVRDETSDLMNKQAQSTDVGDFVVMGVNGSALSLDGTNDMQGLTTDLTAIAWGNNGEPYINGTGNEIMPIGNLQGVCGNMDFRSKRIWMIDKETNGDQNIMIGIGGENFPQRSADYQVFLLVSNTLPKLENNDWDQVIPTHLYNGLHQASYLLTEEITYFCIGVKALPVGSCETCQFSGHKTLNFTSKNWSRGSTLRTFDLGDGFSSTVNVTMGSGGSFYNSRYPDAVSNTLREYRRNNLSPLMTTTITHSYPVAASFQIYAIDRNGSVLDEVDVIGYCDNTAITPVLSYATAENAASYAITSPTHAIAKYTPTASYTSNAGKMNVLFDYPVNKIVITHKASAQGKTSGSQRIGIGPMQLFCMPPIPEANEDGLILTKLASSEEDLSICGDVTYVFQVYNTNCIPQEVKLSDPLPANMKWEAESLQLADLPSDDNHTVNDYGGGTLLEISGLIVPAASSIRISARAVFDENATASTTYTSQGKISYKNFYETSKELESCDRYTANSCAPTSVTTNANETRVKPVVVVHTESRSSYSPNNNIRIRFEINNVNPLGIGDVALDVSFNEAFTYLTGSERFDNLTGTVTFDGGNGNFNITNLTLPQGNAWFDFVLTAPSKNNLEGLVDNYGNMLDVNGNITADEKQQAILPLLVEYSFSYSGGDKCEENAISGANGEIQIPYSNKQRAYIIGNKHVSGFPAK
jgi:hypothetical protein